MPAGESVVAIDLIDVLKKKHTAKGYKSMVGISTPQVIDMYIYIIHPH